MIGEVYYLALWLIPLIGIIIVRRNRLIQSGALFMAALALSFPFFTADVLAQNRPPNVQGLPDISYHRQSEPINLDDYVSDPDNAKSQLAWSIRSMTGDRISATIDSHNVLVFSTSPPTQAREVFQVTATDPGGLNGSDFLTVQSGRFEDGGEACKGQLTDSSLIMVDLGNEANALEQIIYVFYALCLTISALELIALTLNTLIIGSLARSPAECKIYVACGGHTYCASLLAICAAIDAFKKATAKIYMVTKPFCCFITCGWCSSFVKESDYRPGEGGSSSAGCPAPFGKISTSVVDYVGVSIDPFENIYTAMACMCPVAILLNLRKMRTVYSVYECCVSQACEKGFDKQICETYLKEAECMYLTAAWQKSLVSILARKLIAYVLAEIIEDKVIDAASPWTSWIRLGTVVLTIDNLISVWSFIGKTFAEPQGSQCESQFQDYYEDFYTPPDYSAIGVPGLEGTSGRYDLGDGWEMEYVPGLGEYIVYNPKDAVVHASDSPQGFADRMAERQAVEMAIWQMANLALGSWAYPYIDQQCKDEAASSRPQHPGPTAVVTSQSIGQLVNCNGQDKTSLQSSGTIEKIGLSLYEVKASYSLTHCNVTSGLTNYAIYLSTPSGAQDQVWSGTISFDEIHGGMISRNYSSNYSLIKFVTSDPTLPETTFRLTIS